jgi:glycosyltransferase involved in cell wall biosynthesis
VAADGAAVREELGLGEDDLLLGFIGRISPEKNLAYLLQAIGLVLQALPHCSALIVGDGTAMQEARRAAAKTGCADRIHFTGALHHDQVPPYQAALDLFVTASKGETQPLAYTEAMACGKTIVALEAPGAVDMITSGRNGVLVPAGATAEEFAHQVRALLTDPSRRRQLGAAAAEWVRRYDVEVVAARLEELYLQVLG